jgi:hypothetical protein
MNWYYVINGQQTGPVTEAQLDELARAGTIKSDTLVWAEGMANWLPYSQARGAGVQGQPPIITPMQGGFSGMQASSTDVAKRMVQGPAIGLIVSGALGALIGLANLAQSFMAGAGQQAELQKAMSELPPEFQHWGVMIEKMTGPMGMVFVVIGLLISVFTIFAGVQMQRLRNFWMPMTASILGILSCFSGCCCVSLPIGIWAIVVLMKPEVKAAFE